MSRRAPTRKPGAGPHYYRMAPVGGLIFMLVLVIVLIFVLFRIG